jgi:hypothetical protein
LKSWSKFEQVPKKVTTPRALQMSAFNKKSTFDFFFALFWNIKRASLYMPEYSQKISTGFSIKS